MTPYRNLVPSPVRRFSRLGAAGLLAASLLLGASGCNKAADSAAPQPAESAEVTAALTELTQALRKYALEKHGLPKTFAELVAAGYVKNPPTAPAGKKFEIDPKTSRIVLINQ